jgi:hypothetical protein
MANDILINDLGFIIENGDFKASLCDNQNIQTLITSQQGEFKEYPLFGIGIDSFVNGSGVEQELRSLISTQLRKDGANIIDLQLLQNEANKFDIFVNANY